MRAILLILALLPTFAMADGWSDADKTREGIYLALHVVDLGQTRNIARHPEKWSETQPALGSHPSLGRVNAYFALTGIAHVLIVDALPSEWRPAFQYITIGDKAGAVAHNFSIGISASF